MAGEVCILTCSSTGRWKYGWLVSLHQALRRGRPAFGEAHSDTVEEAATVRLARFRKPDGSEGFGVLEGDRVADVSAHWESFQQFLSGSRHAWSSRSDPWFELDAIHLLPPIGAHAKILCVGYNYANHATEVAAAGISRAAELPEHPTLFTRYPDSLVGHGQNILRPFESEMLDWEGELAVVIGEPSRRIHAAEAPKYIAGFTCFADNSVRDWQFHSTQATAGKNWPASGACGPWLVTPDEVGDSTSLDVRTRLNGELVQRDTTTHLAFPVNELLAYVTTFTPLSPGDVIATGTPSGVGFRRQPARYLCMADVLEVEVCGVGTLRNTVVDEVTPTSRDASR